MSVQSRLKRDEIEQRREAASADIEQREKESLRRFIPKFPEAKLKINDPSWYKKFQPVGTVISLPNFVSKTVPVPNTLISSGAAVTTGTGDLATIRARFPMPSVIVHNYLPHIGKVMDPSVDYILGDDESEINTNPDIYPINNALLRDLMQIGKVNSRTVIPDPSILGFYFIVSTDLYSLAKKVSLALSVALHFESTDISVPKSIITGLGFDYVDFTTNIKDWRAAYQELVSLLNSAVPVPHTLTYFERRLWLSSTIVKSTESSLSPIQVFSQRAYGCLNDDATEIDYTDWQDSLNSKWPLSNVSKFRAWYKKAINGLLLNEEICTLISNMRAAIPEEKFYLCDLELPKYIDIPCLDEVRLIIQNMTVLPLLHGPSFNSTNLTEWSVRHDVDGNLYQPGYVDNNLRSQYFSKLQKSFNSFRPMSEDQYLVASRLKSTLVAGINSSSDQICCMKTCGTEVMVGSVIYLTGNDNTILLATDMNAYYDHNYATLVSLFLQYIGGSAPFTQQWIEQFIDEFDMEINVSGWNDIMYNPLVTEFVLSYAKTIDGIFDLKSVIPLKEGTLYNYLIIDHKEVDYFVTVTDTELNYINEVCVKSLYYLEDNDFKSEYTK